MTNSQQEWSKAIRELPMRKLTRYVLGFAFIGPRVVLIEKAKPAWQKGKLNGVGGKIEPGEEPVAAMAREFLEETGANTLQSEWTYRGAMVGRDWTVEVFAAHLNPGTIVRTMESEEVHTLYLAELKYVINLIENVRALIELCRIPAEAPSMVFPTFTLSY